MFNFFRKKAHEGSDKTEQEKTKNLSKSLMINEALFRKIFKNDDTIIYRTVENQANPGIKLCILFVDGMVNSEIINENIIRPITINSGIKANEHIIDKLKNQVIQGSDITKTSEISRLTQSLVSGDTILMVDGIADALIINSKGWKTRAISEPESEKSLRGPREGFTESLLTNLSLIRRKLMTPDLKFKFGTLGVRSNTKTCICYIEGLASEAILKELDKRLEKIEIDGILGTGYIVELIRDSPTSPFKTIGSTERPDIIAAKLLEGRIALLIEGSPVAITLPHIFIEYFQTNDDYYIHFIYSSLSRVIRIISFLFTISVPAIYLALTTFHQEMIPTPLLLSISAARQGIPFPSIIELIILGLAFEILREAGMRLPTNIGSALGIVGGVILGQAAVQAKIVSAPMVIVTGITAVTELIIPRLMGATIILRLTFVALSSILGLYGYIFGLSGLVIHLFQLRSFGVPYMTPLNSLNLQDLKDTVIRAPWWYMNYRPKFIGSMDRLRQPKGAKKP